MADSASNARRSIEPTAEERILAMKPEDRAALAAIMRRRRDKIPAQIAKLQDEQQQLNEWLAKFDPDGAR